MIKTFSYIGIGTPLPEAIDRLLHGRVKIFNHRRQTDYIRSLCYGNVEKLHQILHTIDEAVQIGKASSSFPNIGHYPLRCHRKKRTKFSLWTGSALKRV